MAQNSLFPGFVKIKYTVAGRAHHQILPVEPEDFPPNVGSEPNFITDSGVISMTAAIEGYDDIIDDFFNTTDTNIILAEHWGYTSETSDPIFVYALPIGHAGASATATNPYSQAVFSFRTSTGGYLKLYYMETRYSSNQEDPFPFTAAERTALYNYLTNPATNWIKGRDGGSVISGMNFFTKTNDALRKKYLLNSQLPRFNLHFEGAISKHPLVLSG